MERERAARYSDLFGVKHEEHTSDCAYCPICTTIGAIRKTRPEVLEHFAAGTRELMIAMGLLLEGAGDILNAMQEKAAGSSAPSEPDNNVRHIDIA